MTADKRRALFETVRARAHQAGLSIDDDPRFLELVDLWIDGHITSVELRGHYLELLSSRQDTKGQQPAWARSFILTEDG